MSRPNDDGQRWRAAHQVQTQTDHLHFANDGGARKALDIESLLARLNYSATEPSLRTVGDMLREIGGRP